MTGTGASICRMRRRRLVLRKLGGSGALPIRPCHLATYQFPDLASLERATSGAEMKRMVADFDRAFPGIPRTREITELAEEWAAR